MHARRGWLLGPTASPSSSTTRRTLDHGAWRQPGRHGAGTCPGARAARPVGSRPRCTTGHLVPSRRAPPAQMIPASPPPNPATNPTGVACRAHPAGPVPPRPLPCPPRGLAPPLAQLASQLPGTFARPTSEAAPAAEGVDPARPRDDRAAGGISCDPDNGSRPRISTWPDALGEFFSRGHSCAPVRGLLQQPLSCSHCCCSAD